MSQSLEEGKKFYRKALKLAKRSPWFDKVNREYHNIDGYEPFSTVSQSLAYNLFGIESSLMGGGLTVDELVDDFALSAVTISAWTLAHNPFPVWWLDKGLFQAFEASDLPKAIADLRVNVPFGIIMLPRDHIINPDKDSCNWVFFQYLPQGFRFPVMRFGLDLIESMPVDCDKIKWATILQNGANYASIIELAGDQLVHGDFDLINGGVIDANEDRDLEQQFQDRIEKIVLQTLLYLQFRPDDLISPTKVSISTKGQGFGGGKAKSDRLTPLIVGQKFQPQTERTSRSAHSTHATPRTHWRRGHWRRVAMGEGRQERKWRWIQPVLVNG
ncbi:hypothetical protein NG791_26340 [Laspinema sp. D1]|uniref:hypothetical protein n=1 Tax=Laspinema palackyanum TaxID=3231601 RepID=UPI0034911C95|nr:hypothetical protein [Laspinema sp. D2b]